MKDVHFTSIFENYFIIELQKSLDSWLRVFELNEGFPNLGLFKDEDFDNFSIRYKKLIKVIMSDDITKPIVHTDQQDGPLVCRFVYHCAV